MTVADVLRDDVDELERDPFEVDVEPDDPDEPEEPDFEPVEPWSWPHVAVRAPGAQVAPPGGSDAIGVGVLSAYAGASATTSAGPASTPARAAPASTAERRCRVAAIAHLLDVAAGAGPRPVTSLVSHQPQE